MVARTKQRTSQHLIDAAAQDLLRASLPRHWVLREYRPDYGLDFDVEVFRGVGKPNDGSGSCETLGEHVFLQLKGCQNPKRRMLTLYGRTNVEKAVETEKRTDHVAEIEVLSYPLDVAELLTIQRMGSALPVLLVVADLSTESLFFVCLNDYIDKLLLPAHGGDYTTRATRTIHVPVHNRVSATGLGLVAFRWYAKRAKLFAAFQKFVYQYAELQYASETAQFEPMARHFAAIVARYDFWHDTEMWAVVSDLSSAISRFLQTGRPAIMRVLSSGITAAVRDDEDAEEGVRSCLARMEILDLWRRLALLPRNYEDVCREWFLPTPLGFLSSWVADELKAETADDAESK